MVIGMSGEKSNFDANPSYLMARYNGIPVFQTTIIGKANWFKLSGGLKKVRNYSV